MTEKQKRFCDEYLIDCNAKQAAIRAGYTRSTASNASQWINPNNKGRDPRIPFYPEMYDYIHSRLNKLDKTNIADAQEVLEYLTSVLRGESSSSVLAFCGDGGQEVVKKSPDEKERLKAAQLIGKRYGLFRESIDVGGAVPIVISGSDLLED